MTYGVPISKESFVFTRFGVTTVGALREDAEILGVPGVGKCTKYKRIELRDQRIRSSRPAIRLITQATDSVLVLEASVFSERVRRADELLSTGQIEFYNPPQAPEFRPGLSKMTMDLNPEAAYAIGILNTIVHNDPKCMAFLFRYMADSGFSRSVSQSVDALMREIEIEIKVEIKKGKLNYSWIILKGNALDKIRQVLSSVTPQDACMRLGPRQLETYVAGMLDSHLSQPVYGGDPVLTFSKQESIKKRFLHNMLLLFDSRVVETSCITAHAPKLLEATVILGKAIEVRNPAWKGFELQRETNLFSRTRGSIDTKTPSTNMIFDEQGFSPIVDGLYTYPQILSD
jgi:hypothetical protein